MIKSIIYSISAVVIAVIISASINNKVFTSIVSGDEAFILNSESGEVFSLTEVGVFPISYTSYTEQPKENRYKGYVDTSIFYNDFMLSNLKQVEVDDKYLVSDVGFDSIIVTTMSWSILPGETSSVSKMSGKDEFKFQEIK